MISPVKPRLGMTAGLGAGQRDLPRAHTTTTTTTNNNNNSTTNNHHNTITIKYICVHEVCMYVCIYIYIYVYMCVYIYIYIHTCTTAE